MNTTVDAFNLLSDRRARIALRRRRSRRGLVLAVGAGLALQGGALYRQAQQTARQDALSERLAHLAPQLAEVRDLERQLADAASQRAAWARLEPRRRGMHDLLNALSAAGQDGIAVTEISVRQASDPVAAALDDANALTDRLADNAGHPVSDSATLTSHSQDDRAALAGGDVRLVGIADDADGVARWATLLAAQHGIESVSLHSLSRLEPTRRDEDQDDTHASASASAGRASEIGTSAASGGLLRFRVDLHLRRAPDEARP